jgi:hypothetical protein
MDVLVHPSIEVVADIQEGGKCKFVDAIGSNKQLVMQIHQTH